jgi:hypothetical protein
MIPTAVSTNLSEHGIADMKSFKQIAKMSHGGHYCWGGKVMKKAEGGSVKKYKTIEDIIEETKGIKVNPEVRRKSTIPDMTPEEMRRVKATSDAEERKRRYDEETEDMRENPINKAKGGVARPFWETKNPKKESKKMTPAQKAFAKARAKKAGRPYPNLIDNAAASRRAK